MKNTENKEKSGTALRAVVLAAPFVLISVAIVLMTLWLFNNVIASSSLYRLAVGTDPATVTGGQTLLMDDAYKEKIKEENAEHNFGTPADFPVIQFATEWARLTIEGTSRVQNVRVNAGDDYSLMLGAVGFNYNSSYPGLGGKTVLCGHVKQEFRELETVPLGTMVYLNTVYGEYVYRVYDTVIFGENDVSAIADDGTLKNVLMIYTCYPYASATRRTQRFALMCEMISGRDWTEEAANASD